MKVYVGKRTNGNVVITINGDVELSPEPSYKLRNHSPTGFEYGYRGSGPTQLALALLLDCTGNATTALDYYIDFRDEFINQFAYDGFVIIEMQILMWVEEKKKGKSR